MNFLSKMSSYQKPKKQAIAVYVGPESIEVIQIKRTPKGISVLKSIHKDIPKKEVNSGILRDLFLKEGIKETSVTTTLPEESIMLRRFTMPLIPPQDRQVAVRFEAKRHIPFNIDEIISTYYILKEDKIKNQMEVLFFAAKKEDINYTIALLANAGLIVEKIEPISLALIKSLILAGNLSEISPPTAILHFSTKTEAQITIVENSVPYLKREISLISKELKVEEQLRNEMRLSLSYYKREFPEKNIAKFIVCGLKEIPSWLDIIKSDLNIPAEYALPLKKIADINLPNPQMEVVVGLASRRIEKSKIELNLLPEEFAPVKYNISKITTAAIIIAVSIMGLTYLTQIPKLATLNREVASAESKKLTAPELDLSVKSMDELNALKLTLEQKRDILSNCIRNKISWHKKLKHLIQIMPEETWITELSIKNSINDPVEKSLTFKGSIYAPDSTMEIEIINNFTNSLKNDLIFMEGLKTLTLGSITKSDIQGYEVANFDITLTAQ